MLPLLPPNPQVIEIYLWIPAPSLPSSRKDLPSDDCWAQMLLPAPLVKPWAQGSHPEFLWDRAVDVLHPLFFIRSHLLSNRTILARQNRLFQIASKKAKRKKCLQFNSDVIKTLPGSAAVNPVNTNPIFLWQS